MRALRAQIVLVVVAGGSQEILQNVLDTLPGEHQLCFITYWRGSAYRRNSRVSNFLFELSSCRLGFCGIFPCYYKSICAAGIRNGTSWAGRLLLQRNNVAQSLRETDIHSHVPNLLQ